MKKLLLLLSALALLFLAGCQSANGHKEFSEYRETYGSEVYEPDEDNEAGTPGDFVDDTQQIQRSTETQYLWGSPAKQLAYKAR